MLHQILGNEADPFLRAHDRFQRRPLALEFLFVFQFLAFGRFLEIRVNFRLLLRFQFQLRQATFVVDRDRGLVFDRPLDIIDGDILTENRARVRVRLFDRRAGEPDERRVWQRVVHVPREAVNEIVLAAVRFVCDDDYVSTLGKCRHSRELVAPLSLWERGRG